MRATGKAALFLLLAIVLASCNVIAPQPTQTPTSTDTPPPTATNTPVPTATPTDTPVPPTPTRTPTPTKTPTRTSPPPTKTPSNSDLPLPSGTPLSEWQEIPIMPGAIAGDWVTGSGYKFTIDASFDQIQNYYVKELGKRGWGLFATGEGNPKSKMLMFMKKTTMVVISIIKQSDGTMLVLLTK